MRRMDQADLIRWGTAPLIDNHPRDAVLYHIGVDTGFTLDSGTRSNICFKLVGESGQTTIRRLKDEDGKVFSAGSNNNFLLTVPKSLGTLQYLHIWHDSSGLGADASWYLHRVIVSDVQAGKWYCFLCNRWLAVDKDDGKIDRVLPVAGKEDVCNFEDRIVSLRHKGVTDNHLWLSVFLRPQPSRFTRVQRLSCCLSLLFAYLISNAMFYKTDSESKEENYTWITFGPIRFALQEIYIGTVSSLVILPVNLLIVQFFRKSRRTGRRNCCVRNTTGGIIRDEMDQTAISFEKEARCMLPWWFIIIGWIGVVLVTGVSAVIVIMYSMYWGADKSKEWLTSCMTSFLESILFIEPIQVVIIAYVLALMRQKMSFYKDATKYEIQKGKSEDKDETTRLVPDFTGTKKDNSYGPLGLNEVEKIRMRRTREKQMMIVLYGILFYSLLVGVSLKLCFYVRDPSSYNLNNHIRTPDDYWKWMDTVFLPNTRPTDENGTSITKFTGSLFYLGTARIRQQRHKKGVCETDFDTDCELFGDTETTDFDNGWQTKKINGNVDTNVSSNPWQYQDHSTLAGTSVRGKHGYYDIDGYVVPVQRMTDSTWAELRENSWIDKYTSVVLVEFDLYSPGSELFMTVIYLVEFLQAGGAECTTIQHSLRLLNRIFSDSMIYDGDAILIFVCWVLFGIFGIVLLVSLLRRIVKQRLIFFQLPWNYFDLVMTLITFTSLVFMVVYDVHSTAALKGSLHENGGNLQKIAALNDALIHLLGLQIFFAILRFLKLLRFNRRMKLLSMTLGEAKYSLLSYTFVMLMFLIMFTLSSYLLYHSNHERFKTIVDTLRGLYTISVGKFARFDDMEGSYSMRFALPFIVIFAMINLVVITNIMIVIINDAFSRARAENDKLENYFEMLDYLLERMKDMAVNVGLIRGKTSDIKDRDVVENSFAEVERGLERINELVDSLGRTTRFRTPLDKLHIEKDNCES
ncbi:polycystin-1-like protein 2 [Glandiceps talaboti]